MKDNSSFHFAFHLAIFTADYFSVWMLCFKWLFFWSCHSNLPQVILLHYGHFCTTLSHYRYSKTIAGNGVLANVENPEVYVSLGDANSIVNEQIAELEKAARHLSNAKLGIDVDWLDFDSKLSLYYCWRVRGSTLQLCLFVCLT